MCVWCGWVAAELHNQLLGVETEMNNKNKEIQTLHNSLTEAMVSKERLEQRVMELMEMSQHSMPDDSLQSRVQVSLCNITYSKLSSKFPLPVHFTVHLCLIHCTGSYYEEFLSTDAGLTLTLYYTDGLLKCILVL